MSMAYKHKPDLKGKDIERIAKLVMSQMPAALQDVSYIAQASSSMGHERRPRFIAYIHRIAGTAAAQNNQVMAKAYQSYSQHVLVTDRTVINRTVSQISA